MLHRFVTWSAVTSLDRGPHLLESGDEELILGGSVVPPRFHDGPPLCVTTPSLSTAVPRRTRKQILVSRILAMHWSFLAQTASEPSPPSTQQPIPYRPGAGGLGCLARRIRPTIPHGLWEGGQDECPPAHHRGCAHSRLLAAPRRASGSSRSPGDTG